MDTLRYGEADLVKATYGALYHRLIQVLYIADIAGASYIARDEYAPEVTTILPLLPKATCETDGRAYRATSR